jgi:hypothetical protein
MRFGTKHVQIGTNHVQIASDTQREPTNTDTVAESDSVLLMPGDARNARIEKVGQQKLRTKKLRAKLRAKGLTSNLLYVTFK